MQIHDLRLLHNHCACVNQPLSQIPMTLTRCSSWRIGVSRSTWVRAQAACLQSRFPKRNGPGPPRGHLPAFNLSVFLALAFTFSSFSFNLYSMLPSRLYRNTGIPPPLRSLLIPHPSLPATISVQLRLRLGVLPNSLEASRRELSTSSLNSNGPLRARNLSTSPARSGSQGGLGSSTSIPATTATSSQEADAASQVPRMQITFTCTAEDCDRTRSTHQFTKKAYESGIVLIQCPGCKNR